MERADAKVAGGGGVGKWPLRQPLGGCHLPIWAQEKEGQNGEELSTTLAEV